LSELVKEVWLMPGT